MKRPLYKIAVPVLALPRAAKRLAVISVDTSLCVLSVWLAYYLRLGEFVALSGNALLAVAASIGISLPIFIVSGLYRAIFRYSGLPALLTVARAVGIYGLFYDAIFTAIGIAVVYRCIARRGARVAGRSIPQHPLACLPPEGTDLWRRNSWPAARGGDGKQLREAGSRLTRRCRPVARP